jgi:hypothetical protein
MNLICPRDGRVCMLGCEPRCAEAPKINPAATFIPDEKFRGIFPPFVEKLQERVSVETNLQDEHKINISIPL